MADETLFGELPETDRVESGMGGAAAAAGAGARPGRMRAMDLDALLPAEHPARVIWAYVEKLDLSALEEAVRRVRTGRVSRRQPAASTGAVALCDQPGGRQRPGARQAGRKP